MSNEVRPSWWPKTEEEAALKLSRALALPFFLAAYLLSFAICATVILGPPFLGLNLILDRMEELGYVYADILVGYSAFVVLYIWRIERAVLGDLLKHPDQGLTSPPNGLINQLPEAIFRLPLTPYHFGLMLLDYPGALDKDQSDEETKEGQ